MHFAGTRFILLSRLRGESPDFRAIFKEELKELYQRECA
jgi:hypothetical protein